MATFTAGSVLTAANLNTAINGPTINAQTANYTLATTDYGKLVTVNMASAGTVTVTTALSGATAGVAVGIAQLGAGQTSIAAGSGVTISAYGSATKLAGQYAAAQLYCTGTNTWLLAGNIA